MGNAISDVHDHIEAEFKRVAPVEGKKFLVLDELLQIEPPRHYPIDFTHVGTLYVLDGNKSGRFTVQKLHRFAELVAEQEVQCDVTDDLQTHFQAYATIALWKAAVSPGGVDQFAEWFGRLFSENVPAERFESHPGIEFLSRDTIQTLHTILDVQKSYGVDYQDFFDLMQRVAEEQGTMTLDDDALDDVVPFGILTSFARDFGLGFIRLMSELGFSPDGDMNRAES